MAYDIALNVLVGKVLLYSHDANIPLLRKAYHFTDEAHCDQKRKEGTPYISHPLAVASILADMHLDEKAIIAGLLHDTVEDTETTIEDIKSIFGEDVAFMVSALTKLSRMELKASADAQAENFRKMFLAMAEDVRVIMIKFADRLHNMKTLQYMPEHKQKKIATETLDIYAPLANRLGIGWLKSEFEDLGFKYKYSEKYKEIEQKVAEKREDKEKYIREIARIVDSRLKEQGIAGRVNGRVKTYYGIYQKMQKQKITFDEVNDILGLRVITDTKSHCYSVMGLIHSLWIPVPGRFKDYIAMPKSNMYQSLHTTVHGPDGFRVEFQIRTEEMHLISENGIAAHWAYKERCSRVEQRDTQCISWLRELIHSNGDFKDAREFLEVFKGSVFPDVVFVFTPKGEIMELPQGATPIDFAYAIHSEVGNKCVGARVNRRIVPLRYQLENGDAVEIITSQNHAPSRDWLNFVVTHKARNRIRHWIKSEQRKQGIELGTNMLEEECRRQGIKFSKLKSKEMIDIAKDFNYKTFEDLLMAIGYGKHSAKQVARKLKVEQNAGENVQQETIVRPAKTAKAGISITGIDNLLYTTARCCYPVPGDEIIGFITRGKGVTIHRTNCKNVQQSTLDELRMIEVSWNAKNGATSQARLYVETVDRPGVLANLSSLISSLEINLSHLEARSDNNNHAHFTFTLDVKDKEQLSTLSNKLLSAEGVLSVGR
ncbi:MAG: bifunctional (p)ppGpp synthetase/guanosine-3',5'-bis(diphosphate) 3'-pyrophosphohydrolase [Candidatus Magnetoovum sp. WYHC-5]|nr:bifunctional (p)ppGpp synthetase/guanosine-3',5'-bis(diphosphate) 3'-pyrophosphohydrolase [Candidatus Magnetoovum sp. WYHC-5]